MNWIECVCVNVSALWWISFLSCFLILISLSLAPSVSGISSGSSVTRIKPFLMINQYIFKLQCYTTYGDLQLTNQVFKLIFFLLTSDSRNISSGREQAGTSAESTSPQYSLLHCSLCHQGPFNQRHCDCQLHHTWVSVTQTHVSTSSQLDTVHLHNQCLEPHIVYVAYLHHMFYF